MGFSTTKSQAKEAQIQLQEKEKQQNQEQQMWRIYGIEAHQKELPSNRRMWYTLSHIAMEWGQPIEWWGKYIGDMSFCFLINNG